MCFGGFGEGEENISNRQRLASRRFLHGYKVGIDDFHGA